MKQLPVGIQSFPKLRESNCLYVDKTADCLRLIESGSVLFLSRPRRFGKSLLASTLEEIFKGNKALFEGLAIYDKWDWTRTYPVVRIDWANIAHRTPEIMEEATMHRLATTAEQYGVVLTSKHSVVAFQELIEKLHAKTNTRVVVLVDEYDKPIIDALSTPECAVFRSLLRDLYNTIKGSDEHLRFVFFTGVSKFAGLSIFSGLNNLKDITLNPNFASICGYTQQELESNFPEHIAATAEAQKMSVEKLLAEIKFWYNGYSWDSETSVYNPFSTLLFFDLKDFDNFWFQSGTPTFLVEIIKKRNDIQPILEPVAINYIQWSFHEPETMELAPLLMQTGYLTIKEKRGSGINREYILDFPNFEVRQSFLAWVLNAYSNCPISSSRLFVNRLTQSILSGNTAELEKGLREMLAGIPYKLHLPREAYYHSLFLVWVRLLGFEIQGEYLTDIGRIDAVWRIGERVVIAEIKCQPKKKDTAKLLKEAFAQIKEKRYADTFGAGKQVTYLAIAFADKQVAAKIENA